MAISYKKLFHLLIEDNINNTQLMRNARISTNIITELKSGQYIALDKVEIICAALNCTPNDILNFLPTELSKSGGINYV